MTTRNTKPTYEELEYQLAVTHAAYKELKVNYEDLEGDYVALKNFMNRKALEIQELVNQ